MYGGLGRRSGGVVEEGKAAIRERRQGNTNRNHQVIQDYVKKVWVYYIRRCYIGHYNQRLM